jgi:ABC-2 type transport system ATP-binding protein
VTRPGRVGGVCNADRVSKKKKPAPPPLLRVRGLRRRFGEIDVVSGFDLDLEAGTAVALVGRNGAGKSTVLRCITGADKATAGTVELDGRPLDERSPTVRADLAIVLDDMDFFPDLSVVEHLDLFARAHRVDDAEAVVDAVLNEVGLIAQSGQLPGTLSSGQRRRLALASAFVRPRRLLVLDEPEQRLDTAGLDWLAERLAREKADGLGVLLASHSPQLVEAIDARVMDVGETS